MDEQRTRQARDRRDLSGLRVLIFDEGDAAMPRPASGEERKAGAVSGDDDPLMGDSPVQDLVIGRRSR